jgi:tetratricopeptide (TPR) repeat protein
MRFALETMAEMAAGSVGPSGVAPSRQAASAGVPAVSGCHGWLLFVLSIGLAACQAPEVANPAPDPAVYVGDEACANCHEDLYASYHRTGMGRAVSRFDPQTAPERFDGRTRVYSARDGYFYEAFVRNDTLFQREYRQDSAGRVTYEQVYPAAWVIGSGHATRSYLMAVNGHVTEMPLTWYVERQRWDLSPSYEQENQRFSRPINEECMHCHNGPSGYTPFTESHYAEVALGITCERCHGPGSWHVEARLAGLETAEGEADTTIVQPARLSRALQLDVCQQCHLTGVTVFKPGEDMMTFRPGQPLAVHRTVFAPEEQVQDPERFGISSQAARLAQSACFQQGALTCTTCHNPHVSVRELGPDHFNQTCIRCHDAGVGAAVCSREAHATPAEAMSGNCVGCHMQKGGTSDIPHVRFTDHWIRRRLPPARDPDDLQRILVRSRPLTLVPVGMTTSAPSPRDEALAYYHFFQTRHRLPVYLPQVIRLARQARQQGADDAELLLTLGRALADQDSLDAAAAVLAEAATRNPGHARIHYWLGEVLFRAGKPAEALAPLRTTVAAQPAFNEARIKLAEVLTAQEQRDEATTVLEEAVRHNPIHHPQAWNNLGFLYLQGQQFDEALRRFQRAVALDPGLAVAWVNAGSVHLLRQEYAAAIPLLEKALEADAENIAAWGNLGVAYLELGRYAEAREALHQVLRRQPGEARARALLERVNTEARP